MSSTANYRRVSSFCVFCSNFLRLFFVFEPFFSILIVLLLFWCVSGRNDGRLQRRFGAVEALARPGRHRSEIRLRRKSLQSTLAWSLKNKNIKGNRFFLRLRGSREAYGQDAISRTPSVTFVSLTNRVSSLFVMPINLFKWSAWPGETGRTVGGTCVHLAGRSIEAYGRDAASRTWLVASVL